MVVVVIKFGNRQILIENALHSYSNISTFGTLFNTVLILIKTELPIISETNDFIHCTNNTSHQLHVLDTRIYTSNHIPITQPLSY